MTPRKSSARGSKAAKKTAKSAKPARKGSTSPRAKKASAARAKAPAHGVKRTKPARPARHPSAARGKAAVAAKAKPSAKAAAPAKAAAAVKAVKVAKLGKPAKAVAVARKGAVPGSTPEVRPLGVLPPGSIARSSHRPAVPVHTAPVGSVRPAVVAPVTEAERVTGEELKEFEQRLLEERQKILKEMGHLENTVLKVNQRDSAGDLSGYSFHMADVGTDAMEREKAFLFASSEGRALFQINEALRRLYRGEYGLCESCGQPIARARLMAIPHARLGRACKEKEERANRGAV